MFYKFIFLALLCISLLTNCNSDKQINKRTEPELITLDTLHTFVTFESHNLARPSDLALLGNGNLAVIGSQTKKIFIISTDGNLITTFGEEGRGPREFTQPSAISVINDKIYVVDGNQYKVLEFTLDGDYLNTYAYNSSGVNLGIAVANNETYYSNASGEKGSLIKKAYFDRDSTFLFGNAKNGKIEERDIAASRNDFKNGIIPPYYRNNVSLALDGHYLYAFLESYSELRKYDPDGNLIWEKKINLPDNEALMNQIMDIVTKTPENVLPFLRYSSDFEVYKDKILILGANVVNSPQHLTILDGQGNIETIYTMPGSDYYFTKFTFNPQDGTLYLSDIQNGVVYRTNLAKF